MENTTKEAAHKYAETIAQDEVKKMYSRADFEAGANWLEQQKLLQFEQMKTALENAAKKFVSMGLSFSAHPDCEPNSEFEDNYETCYDTANDIRLPLTSLTENNEKT